MAVFTGIEGSVTVGANVAAEIDKFSLKIGAEKKETTSFGDEWGRHKRTVKNWSGSFSGRFDMSDTAQAALQDALLGGTTVTLHLDTGLALYEGDATIEVSVDSGATDLANVSFDFEGTGALTWDD